MAKKIAYTAVFLDQTSKEMLQRWFEATTGQTLLGTPHAHHMTIKFKPSDAEIAALPLGQKAKLRVVGWAADDKVQAVVVEPEIPSQKAIPHITVATEGDTPPAYANELLARNVIPFEGTLVLEGLVGTYPPRPA